MTPILRCPHCTQLLSLNQRCPTCSTRLLLSDDILDFAPHLSKDPSPGWEQRLMNTRLFARLYESPLWRPLHTRLASGQSLENEIAELLSLGPARAQIVVDLACGTGLYSRALSARYPEATVLGLDRSFAMLSRAQKLSTGPNLHYLRADLYRLPLADQSAEHVNCAGALHLFADTRPVFAEIARILAPEGRLTAMCAGHPPQAPPALRKRVERYASFHPFTPERIRLELRQAGLTDIQIRQHRAVLLFGASR